MSLYCEYRFIIKRHPNSVLEKRHVSYMHRLPICNLSKQFRYTYGKLLKPLTSVTYLLQSCQKFWLCWIIVRFYSCITCIFKSKYEIWFYFAVKNTYFRPRMDGNYVPGVPANLLSFICWHCPYTNRFHLPYQGPTSLSDDALDITVASPSCISLK